MIRDRTFTTLSLAFMIVLIIGIFRPSGEQINTGLNPDEFWIRKAFTNKKYDFVLAGDSRVYRGISPEVIKKSFPKKEIFNYGFSGNGYNRSYLDAITKLIKSDSKIPVIVLGITPMSLTENSAKQNGFLQLREKGVFDQVVDIYLSRFNLPFRPFELYRYYQLLKNDNRLVRYFQIYHPDGWVSGYKIPNNPVEQLAPYKQQFSNNPVSNRVIDLIYEYTREWKKAGIKIFGFRVPSTYEMVTLEDEFSQFDELNFIENFTAAGGKWLKFNQGSYFSYDGSHLHENAAISLSKDLTAKLLESEPDISYDVIEKD